MHLICYISELRGEGLDEEKEEGLDCDVRGNSGYVVTKGSA